MPQRQDHPCVGGGGCHVAGTLPRHYTWQESCHHTCHQRGGEVCNPNSCGLPWPSRKVLASAFQSVSFPSPYNYLRQRQSGCSGLLFLLPCPRQHQGQGPGPLTMHPLQAAPICSWSSSLEAAEGQGVVSLPWLYWVLPCEFPRGQIQVEWLNPWTSLIPWFPWGLHAWTLVPFLELQLPVLSWAQWILKELIFAGLKTNLSSFSTCGLVPPFCHLHHEPDGL